MSSRALPRRFFARDADLVARDLLGRILAHDTRGVRLAARVTEAEAYFGPAGRNPQLAARHDMPAALRRRLVAEGDPASHSFRGVTPRNRIMYGAPGHAYVYLIYGVHECLNVTTGPLRAHEPQAVLVRAGEPVEGLDPATDLGGPGRLAKALGVTRANYGDDMTRGALRFEAGAPLPDAEVAVTPRIGVRGGEALRLRFVARRAKPTSARRAPARP